MKKKQFEKPKGKQEYNPTGIEAKWQKLWEETGIFSPNLDRAAKPFYNLMMFPYPSAEGLHVGNMYAFTGSDIYGCYKRMQKYDVFEPIGLDGFGIHSENYALKMGRHPKEQAKISEKNFYRQLRANGNSYDWSRKLETYDPDYYKWTQWIFIQLFKKGLAYRKKALVNFCPQDKTVLADEQVIDGKCERCGTVVEKQELELWFFRITAYADRLLENLEKLDWSERVKIAQRQWIGRKEGINIAYKIEGSNEEVVCFTTRPDTNFGATFIVIGPEHPLIYKITLKRYLDAVKKYARAAAKKSDKERIPEGRKKTGVFTGSYAINNLNGKRLPIWISDFVLGNVGTGAVVGVPGHDKRDFEFAQAMKLPVIRVVVGVDGDKSEITRIEQVQEEEGTIINSEFLDGMDIHKATHVIMDYLEEKGWGVRQTTYHLRDWLISRQRYWGPPIPMIHCEKCGWQAVPGKDLPVLLPDVRDWKPKGIHSTGLRLRPFGLELMAERGRSDSRSSGQAVESPLASVASFVKTNCPNCGGGAKRETDVSDTFLDSSWYFLRYLSTEITDRAWDKKRSEKWLPVNMYIGGAEHSVLHLLYTRFLSMVFYDLGLVHFEEPFSKFRAHGLLISRGAKMSKSRGNVVVPDAYIEKYGADTLRCYLMFCGRFTQGGDFRDTGIEGMHRFLKRVWRLVSENLKFKISNLKLGEEAEHLMHKTIKRVAEDIESLDYNTAIAALMKWLNFLEERSIARGSEQKANKPGLEDSALERHGTIDKKTKSNVKGQMSTVRTEELEVFLKLLAPFAPHVTEELWQMIRSSVLGRRFSDSGQSIGQSVSGAATKNKPGLEEPYKPGLEAEKERPKIDNWSIHSQPWPRFDPKLAASKQVTLVVQINGKVRDRLPVEAGVSKDEVEKLALASERVQKYLGNRKPQRVVFVADRLINLVI